jgi:hypothetical protein
MTSDLDVRARDGDPGAQEGPPRRRPSLLLPVLFGLGILIYELTAQPGLAAAIACTKFGWNDFLTARWLRRRDPDRRRGRSSFWLFVAAGLWKTAVTGVVVMFAVAFLEGALRRPQQANQPPGAPPALVGALLATIVGFGLSTVATAWAFLAALRHRIRLWIDAPVHADRRADRWPPVSTPGRRNRAGAVLVTAMFLGMMVGLVVLQIVIRVAHRGWGGGAKAQNLADLITNLFCCGVCLIVPVLLLVFRDILGQMALARSPAECWDDDARGVRPGDLVE